MAHVKFKPFPGQGVKGTITIVNMSSLSLFPICKNMLRCFIPAAITAVRSVLTFKNSNSII